MAPPKVFSRAEVAKHNTEEDCWIVIEGRVYDVTRFAGMHPGGEEILLSIGGTDATEDFYGLHRQSVLDKFGPKLMVGVTEDADMDEVSKPTNGLTKWAEISKVPYAETFAWRGFKSPFHDESHVRFRKYIREFYDRELRQLAIECEDSNEPATLEIMQKISQAGLLHTRLGPGPHLKLLPMPCGIKPEEFTYTHEKILQEETARLQCPGFLDSLFAGFNISAPPLVNYGTDKMRKEVLPEILAGRKRSCLAITEAFAGSDVAGLRTTAKLTPDGKHYIVNGTKKWITNATFADYFVTAVRTGGPGAGGISMMLIPKGEGVRVKLIKTAYSSAAGTGYVMFENVKVPAENLMGAENKGFGLVMSNFNHERYVIAVAVIAGCRLAVEECFKWAMQRKVFGKPLMSQAVIREKLGRMVAAVEAADAYADLITHQMNNMDYKEQNMKLGGPISLLKYQATRTAHLVADDAVQIFGGRGVTNGAMGRVVRNFAKSYKLPSVYGGSEEIMVDLGVRQALRFYPRDAKL